MDQRRWWEKSATEWPVPCLPLPKASLVPHQEFPKIPRFNREIVITEKIDGTNGVVYVTEDGRVAAGSRKRWLHPQNSDNFGFAAWVREHESDLRELGPGFHYGEWYGQGIQRNYSLDHRRFALFNVHRWADPNWRPACCDVVTVLHRGLVRIDAVNTALDWLRYHGSATVPGFTDPEGIVIYHTAAKQLFKITLENDEKPKGQG